MKNQENNNQSTWRSSFRWKEYHDYKPHTNTASPSKENTTYVTNTSAINTQADLGKVLTDVLVDQQVWSKTAGELKRKISFLRLLILGLTVTGAALVTIAAQVHTTNPGISVICSVLGAFALVFIPILISQKQSGKQVKTWICAHSISEALKRESYLYLTQTRPYHDLNVRNEKLAKQYQNIISQGDNIQKVTLKVRRELKKNNLTVPELMDVKTYINERINVQIYQFYHKRIYKLSKQVLYFRDLELIMSLIAASLAFLLPFSGFSHILAAWIAVITTTGVAITAHIAVQKYEYQIHIDSMVANRLESLKNTWVNEQRIAKEVRSFRDQGDFIRQCEEVMMLLH